MPDINDVLDVIVEPRYDCQTIPAAGSTLLTYFAQPIGQGTTNWGAATIAKNLSDTNMDIAGTLPAGYNFKVLGFRIMPTWNITQADATGAGYWLAGAVFTFTIGSKPYLRVPVATIPAGNGPVGFYTQAMAAAGTAFAHGFPSLSNGYSIATKPFDLFQTQNFQATITWPSGARAVTTTVTAQAAAGMPVYVFMDGYLYRRVQ